MELTAALLLQVFLPGSSGALASHQGPAVPSISSLGSGQMRPDPHLTLVTSMLPAPNISPETGCCLDKDEETSRRDCRHLGQEAVLVAWSMGGKYVPRAEWMRAAWSQPDYVNGIA